MEISLLNESVAMSALAVVAALQILKLKLVPTQIVNKYPVPALFGISALAAIAVAWQSGSINPVTWQDWVYLGATIAVTAALTYYVTLKNWSDLRQMEG